MSSARLQTDIVRALFESKGYRVSAEVTMGRGLWKGIRADFVIHDLSDYPDNLAIECKWQTSTGSTDEKIAYTVLNIKQCYEIPAIIVCSGSELQNALLWAKSQVEGKLQAVYSTDEFIAWVSKLPGIK
jgi:hypothetical protein